MSKSPRGGLGRGIESLIRTSAHVPAPESPVREPPAPTLMLAEPSLGDVSDPFDPETSRAEPSASAPTAPEPSAPPLTTPEPADGEVTAPVTTPSPLEVFWGPDPKRTPPARDGNADGRPEFRDLSVDDIHANARQPRTVFDDEGLAELAHSVREFGILQPVVVRPDPTAPGTFELVMGERRLRAARAAGLDTIPAVVRHTPDDAMLRDALLENLHRAQLNALEEAAAYQQLLEEFGVTHDELAARIGRSRSQVSNTVRLLNLSLPVQRRVAAGVLSAGHARALLALTDSDAQDELAARIVAEGLSVRATEELVSLTARGLAGATRRRATPHVTAPAATDLAERLSDRFDTTVRVDIGRRKGKVTIEFASVDDLERIVAVMAPGLTTARSPAPVGGGVTA